MAALSKCSLFWVRFGWGFFCIWSFAFQIFFLPLISLKNPYQEPGDTEIWQLEDLAVYSAEALCD